MCRSRKHPWAYLKCLNNYNLFSNSIFSLKTKFLFFPDKVRILNYYIKQKYGKQISKKSDCLPKGSPTDMTKNPLTNMLSPTADGSSSFDIYSEMTKFWLMTVIARIYPTIIDMTRTIWYEVEDTKTETKVISFYKMWLVIVFF